MRHSAKIDNNFYFPLEPDMAMVSILDIELVLPRPNLIGKTKRQRRRRGEMSLNNLVGALMGCGGGDRVSFVVAASVPHCTEQIP
nr:unnamed protein product [Callosobruchus chinensis]